MAFCGIEINVKEVVVEIEEMITKRIQGLGSIHKGSQNNSRIK